jgi:hypothetical protein
MLDAVPHTTAQLVYEADATCPPRVAFESEVAARLGYSPFVVEAPSNAAVRAFVQDGVARVTLHVTLAHQRQALIKTVVSETGDCDEALRSAAASVAIFLDPTFTVPRPPPPPALPSVVAPTDTTPTQSPTESVTLTLGIDATASAGLFPTPSGGGVLRIGMSSGSWSLRGAGRVEGSFASGSYGPSNVRGWLVAGDLSGCYRPGVVIACAGASLGSYRIDAVTAGQTDSQLGPIPFATTRIGWVAPLSRALDAEIGPYLALPLARLEVRQQSQILWSAPFVTAGLSLGLTWTL